MINDNLYWFKRKIRPQDYEEGLVRVYTEDERLAWSNSPGAKQAYDKISYQAGLSQDDLRYLDTLKWQQEEEVYEDIMEGYKANE